MANLWERMSHLYGHKWSSAFGEAAADAQGELTETASTWARGLYGLQGAELARGLEQCVNRKDPWPPSLPEFRALCREQADENTAMYRMAPLALPEPKEAREARRAKGKAAAQMLKSHVRRITGRQNETEEAV